MHKYVQEFTLRVSRCLNLSTMFDTTFSSRLIDSVCVHTCESDVRERNKIFGRKRKDDSVRVELQFEKRKG